MIEDPGVIVHRLPDHFGPRSLAKLGEELDRLPEPRRLLLQYVPQAFGYRGMNLALSSWLARRSRRDEVWAYFHEVAMSWTPGKPASHLVLALVTRFMAKQIVRTAHRRIVAIPGWERMLLGISKKLGPIEWQPVPSSIPVIRDAERVAEIRSKYGDAGSIVGHFGTYGALVWNQLAEVLPRLILESPQRVDILLMGRGNAEFREQLIQKVPEIAPNLHATGSLSIDNLSQHLLACDLMFQPYVDGVSCRRSSLMACLVHGRPVVTTTGHNTEPIWAESGAVAMAPVNDSDSLVELTLSTLADPSKRERMGQAAEQLYRDRFAIERTIELLRETDSERTRLDPAFET